MKPTTWIKELVFLEIAEHHTDRWWKRLILLALWPVGLVAILIGGCLALVGYVTIPPILLVAGAFQFLFTGKKTLWDMVDKFPTF